VLAVLLPISNGRIGFICAKTIALVAYMGSRVLGSSVIVSKFLSLLGQPILGLLPFQVHLRWSQKLLPLTTQLNVYPFQTTCRKGNILISRDHFKEIAQSFFSSIIYDMSFDSHQPHLKSCVGLSVGTWFTCLPNHPMLLFIFNVFSSTLRTKLSIPTFWLLLWLIAYVVNC
jgi:hypothetical protein